VEQIWSLLLNALFKRRTPHDLSRLRGLDWDEVVPAYEVHWEGQTMQAVPLPVTEPAWLVVRPEAWAEISCFVRWIQRRDAPDPVETPPHFTPLGENQQTQLEESYDREWPALADHGVRTLALMHLSGRLISWKSLDGYETAARMGQAAVKDLILTRQFSALVEAAADTILSKFYPAEDNSCAITSSMRRVCPFVRACSSNSLLSFSFPVVTRWSRATRSGSISTCDSVCR
jgi:hypothetical protein